YKQCLAGTREDIIKEITDWVNSDSSAKDVSRIFFLCGQAGSGKSSIAHSIGHQFDQFRGLGSFFCFDRSKAVDRRHDTVLRSVAHDLGEWDKGFRSA